jgi:hypothetical protein
MKWPIRFHDQSSGETHEIRNVWANRDLAAELQACQTAVAQQLPEDAFVKGGVAP